MFYDVYCKLCADRGLTPSGAAAKIGFNRASVTVWKNSKKPPKSELLNKIANYFGVSVDFLLETETKEKPTPDNESGLDDDCESFMQYVQMLTPNQKKFLIAQMQLMLEQSR